MLRRIRGTTEQNNMFYLKFHETSFKLYVSDLYSRSCPDSHLTFETSASTINNRTIMLMLRQISICQVYGSFRMWRANFMSFGMSVLRLAWIQHKLASSKMPVK